MTERRITNLIWELKGKKLISPDSNPNSFITNQQGLKRVMIKIMNFF